MGSSSSTLSSSDGGDRRSFRISSLLCGTSLHDDPSPRQLDDQPNDSATPQSRDDELPCLVKDPSSVLSLGNKTSGPSIQSASSSDTIIEKDLINYSSSSAETSNSAKQFYNGKGVETCNNSYNYLTDSKELNPCGKDMDVCVNGDQALPLLKSLPLGSSSIYSGSTSDPSVEGHHFTSKSGIHDHSDCIYLSNAPQQEHDASFSNESLSARNQDAESSRDEPVQEVTSVNSEFHRTVTTVEERERRSLLHVDLVSVSSDILTSREEDISDREARRNSRRLFWDTFSWQRARRNNDSQSVILSTEASNDLDSNSRWLLDLSEGSDNSETWLRNESGSLNRRYGAYEHRWRSRLENVGALRGSLDENIRNANLCTSGLHPEGSCSCESLLMVEISSARASISRIVLLAEALFEVLDEIHRQPESQSFSMMSYPAPESVVDSFPVRNYKNSNTLGSGQDVEQCYICLAEYEEEDAVRILPCQHEYHMSCVDKWLKEIHGVCPLCRRDVCEGVALSTASSS